MLRERADESLDVRGRMLRIEESIGDGVRPIDGNRHERGMHILPTRERQQYAARFGTAVEHRDIVKMRGILDPDMQILF